MMSIVGALLFLAGGAGTAYAVWASFAKARPLDVIFGLAAPLALIICLTGALLIFVPRFFGG